MKCKVFIFCTNAKVFIFKYELLGLDDTFYDRNSQPKDLDSILDPPYNRDAYSIKIDVEEDNPDIHHNYDRICADNRAQRYFDASIVINNNTIEKRGVITYVGDKNITPPF
ncbi:MAG: hypothetical protein JKX98_06780 [Alcanivoracaceae bacterium]|nr:hypothetical protein [Alcanivoracaceae bacterium]